MAEATRLDRISLAIKLLYGAHKRIVFDTPEDTELQEQILARVRELLGFAPDLIDDDDSPSEYEHSPYCPCPKCFQPAQRDGSACAGS